MNPFPSIFLLLLLSSSSISISIAISSPFSAYNHGRIPIKKCLKQALNISAIISSYLHRENLSRSDSAALEDCRHLSEINVEFLRSIDGSLISAEGMDKVLVERVKSVLSAVVTNGETCYDGLVETESDLVKEFSAPLSNAGKLYSESLGLVIEVMGRKWGKREKIDGVKGLGFNEMFPARGYERESLDTFIKGLRKMGSCKKSRNCSSGRNSNKRLLSELGNKGISIGDIVIVSSSGFDNFTSIGDAIASAPNKLKPQDGYFVVYVKQGYYEEYVEVPQHKTNIMLIGDGINRTVITGNHNVDDGWTTFNSSTFTISGDRFVGIDVTFKNTAGPEKHQAVALRNSADLSTFYRCSFEGYQDTLYVHSLRQFYRECDIYGTIDFIFGNAAAVFQQCNIYARKPLRGQSTVITAQGRTDGNQTTGISIHNCTIEAAPDLSMDPRGRTKNYLGRPWKNFSRTVYMQSYMGDLISEVGWLEWDGKKEGLDTLYYGEYENHGPGADTSKRVNWPGFNLMNASQAMNFTVYNFTTGDTWLPSTDIPFSGGLL